MIISPKVAIEQKWITGVEDWTKFTSPNGIDFTLDKMYLGMAGSHAYIGESKREHRKHIEAYANSAGHVWRIEARESIDGLSNMYVELPEGVSAILIIRSSLSRNGIVMASGLYDSGFKGNIGFYLHNLSSASIQIEQGTRVGQIIFMKSEAAGLYAGHYNAAEGKHWTEVAK